MRRAEARFSASISSSNCIRCWSTGSQVGCTMKTSAPRTFSSICTYVSPSENREMLTNYGPVDILWFDGLGKTTKDYDGEALNTMARKLQPRIDRKSVV